MNAPLFVDVRDLVPPIDYVPGGAAAVSMAVLCGARNVREVANACGWASTSTAHGYLRAARALGLVLWEDRTEGTLRPGLGLVSSSFGRNGFLGG